jgi:uncharacterized protein (TIGR02118 family)
MIKIISAAIKHPRNRTRPEFQEYWATRHGPMFARTPHLRGYIQHITLPEAYDGDPTPTHDGASMFYYDDVDVLRVPPPSPRLSAAIKPEDGGIYDWYVASKRYGDPDVITLAENTIADDRQLFDREPGWPLYHKRTHVVAHEHVVVDGPTTPSMIKALFIASRMPGLSLAEMSQHWLEVHGPLAANVPGLRRYVQNHAAPEAYAFSRMTHDGWAEMWFEDLSALRRARQSPEWKALQQDVGLFAQPMAIVVAREGVQKAPPTH